MDVIEARYCASLDVDSLKCYVNLVDVISVHLQF